MKTKEELAKEYVTQFLPSSNRVDFNPMYDRAYEISDHFTAMSGNIVEAAFIAGYEAGADQAFIAGYEMGLEEGKKNKITPELMERVKKCATKWP